MGKRRKRLTMLKYAKKYASIRALAAKLKGVAEETETDGIVTSEEVEQISEVKQEAVGAVVQPYGEVIKDIVSDTVEEFTEIVEKPKRTKKQSLKRPLDKTARKFKPKKAASRG